MLALILASTELNLIFLLRYRLCRVPKWNLMIAGGLAPRSRRFPFLRITWTSLQKFTNRWVIHRKGLSTETCSPVSCCPPASLLRWFYIYILNIYISPPSWFVTMQICVVSFQSWRNVFGLLLRELRPWRLHWGMPKKEPWWTAAATSRRWTVSRTQWERRMPWDALMQHRSVTPSCSFLSILFCGVNVPVASYPKTMFSSQQLSQWDQSNCLSALPPTLSTLTSAPLSTPTPTATPSSKATWHRQNPPPSTAMKTLSRATRKSVFFSRLQG